MFAILKLSSVVHPGKPVPELEPPPPTIAIKPEKLEPQPHTTILSKKYALTPQPKGSADVEAPNGA